MARQKKEAKKLKYIVPHLHPKFESRLQKQKERIKIYHGLTFGQRLADKVTLLCGSWGFIASFIVFLAVWIMLNIHWLTIRWDPYPFILLNLALSCLAALQAPVILMSQNRQTERDRIAAEKDYIINRKAEREVQDIQTDLEEIKSMIRKTKR